MRQKCDKIISHGCNVFINRQLIYNLPESIFTENGIMAIEHADFDGIERLAAVTGGEVVSTFDRPDLVTMGECDVIEEVRLLFWCFGSMFTVTMRLILSRPRIQGDDWRR